MGKRVLDLKNGKTIFAFNFLYSFAFRQAKEHILFKVKPWKMLTKKLVLSFLGNSQHFWGPATDEKST